jgi:hypothetical protein
MIRPYKVMLFLSVRELISDFEARGGPYISIWYLPYGDHKDVIKASKIILCDPLITCARSRPSSSKTALE